MTRMMQALRFGSEAYPMPEVQRVCGDFGSRKELLCCVVLLVLERQKYQTYVGIVPSLTLAMSRVSKSFRESAQ